MVHEYAERVTNGRWNSSRFSVVLVTCVMLAVGRVLQALPEGKDVWGVTSLNNLIYVLRGKTSQQISVYDVDSYRLQRRINVPRLNDMCDMVACLYYQCLYISGGSDKCVHRVALQNGDVTKWLVNDEPARLSVTDTHSVLVTCDEVRKIIEFSTDGKLLREIQLPQDVTSPCHTVQLSNGQFIVCHGGPNDPVHRVCLVGSDGHVVASYGGPVGSGSQQMNVPCHLAVDENGFVFVADTNNYRVLLLSPELTYVRDVVSRDQLKWSPLIMFLHAQRHRLYIADNKWENEEYTAGRVVIVSLV